MEHPTVFSTADIIVHDDQGNFIVGQKAKDGAKWRLPGGFVDPQLDTCYLDAAVREASEELCFDFTEHIREFVYLGDYEVEDERYKDTEHTIFTNLYAVRVESLNELAAGDDLDKICTLSLSSVMGKWCTEEHIIKEHHHLVTAYLDYFLNSSYAEDAKSD